MSRQGWRQRISAAVEVQYGYVLVYDADASEDDDPGVKIGESNGHEIVATRSGFALPVTVSDGEYALVTAETWDYAPELTGYVMVVETVLEVEPWTRMLRIETMDGRAAGCLWLGHTTRWNARACHPPTPSAEPEWLIQLWPTPDQQRPNPNLLWAKRRG